MQHYFQECLNALFKEKQRFLKRYDLLKIVLSFITYHNYCAIAN